MKVLTAIPVYNEERHVEDVLREVRRHTPDILVVNDGSTDATAALLAKQRAKVGLTDPDAVPPERVTAIVAGDLFELGQHRLLCGDSTTEADVTRLLGKVVPFLMVTDPPYGVDYDPTWRVRAGVNLNRKKLGKVTNDDRADWQEAYAGHLEMWDGSMRQCVKKVLPVFNRCVIFNTSPESFHGHPHPLTCPPGTCRTSIALYYYTANESTRTDETVGYATLWQELPDEKVGK